MLNGHEDYRGQMGSLGTKKQVTYYEILVTIRECHRGPLETLTIQCTLCFRKSSNLSIFSQTNFSRFNTVLQDTSLGVFQPRVARSLTRPTGRVGSENLEGCAGRVGSGQDGLGTQIWRHEIELVIKCCLVCISCRIWLLYIILLFSMYMYVGDRTVDEMLSASASAWNCRHNGTIVL